MTEIKAVEMDYLKQAIGTDGMPALSWVPTPKPYISEINVHAYIKCINKIDLYMI